MQVIVMCASRMASHKYRDEIYLCSHIQTELCIIVDARLHIYCTCIYMYIS